MQSICYHFQICKIWVLFCSWNNATSICITLILLFEAKWAARSLIIGLGCWFQVFAWSSIAHLVCEWAFSLLAIWCLRLQSFESCIQQRMTTCLLLIRNPCPVPEHYQNQTRNIYCQSQEWTNSCNEIKRAECSHTIGMGCWDKVFARCLIAQLVCERAFSLLVIW